jgi:hypothetical protein
MPETSIWEDQLDLYISKGHAHHLESAHKHNGHKKERQV